MSQLFDRINEGGLFFMLPIIGLFIIIMVLFIRALLKMDRDREKTISLMSSLGLFALVWGVLGQVIGLIMAFDSIQGSGAISMEVLAGGLKVSFLPTLFGLMVFLDARLGIIILTWLKK